MAMGGLIFILWSLLSTADYCFVASEYKVAEHDQAQAVQHDEMVVRWLRQVFGYHSDYKTEV